MELEILYVHGFGSKYNPNNDKVRELSKIGSVDGPNLDYTQPFEATLSQALDFLNKKDYDLLVGTSMGGWCVSHLSAKTGTPFVAINPAMNPAETLAKHIGSGVDYTGREYNLTEDVVRSYPPLRQSNIGMVLLDEGDELFDSSVTAKNLNMHNITFAGGSHRFDHMHEALLPIKSFFMMVVHG